MPISNPSEMIPREFAYDASPININTIPNTTGSNQEASFKLGFPPDTMIPVVSGGIPPLGADFNGIFNLLSTHAKFLNIGGVYKFDASVATIIGGYDKGTVLQSDDGTIAYVSAIDNNTINFNTTPSSIGVQWKQWAGGVTGAPVYTEDEKWDLMPVGTCIYYIEEVVGDTLSAFLSSHPKWKPLNSVPFLDIAHTVPGTTILGRALAAPGNSHNAYATAGSDNASLILHNHGITDTPHTHSYVDYYNSGAAPALSFNNGGLLTTLTAATYGGANWEFGGWNWKRTGTTATANLNITSNSAGSGNGTNANIQRTIYIPLIIKTLP